MSSSTKQFWYMFHLFVMFAILLFLGLHFDYAQGECEDKYLVDADASGKCIGDVSACNSDKYCGTPTKTRAVCKDDDAAIAAAYGDDTTCELMASHSMCDEVGPEGEGAISDICKCSCEGSVFFLSSTWGTECWCRESKQIYDSTISFLVFGCLYWCYIALSGCFVCCDNEDTLDNPVMRAFHICANLILMICIIFTKPLGTSYGAFGLAFWILQIPLFCVTVYSDSFCLPDLEEKGVHEMYGHRAVPLAAPTMTTIDLEFGNDTHMNNQNQLQSNHSQKNQDNSPAPLNPPAYSQAVQMTTEGWGNNV